MGKKKKYTASFATVVIGKAATFGFKEKSYETLDEFANQLVRQSSIPVTLSGTMGHRAYDNVTKIHGWLRFDCDMKGEKETIVSILKSRGLAYIATPSTNYNPITKSHKWHISVPATNQSNEVYSYKAQTQNAMIDLGIEIEDDKVTKVCTQNMNPYRNGDKPLEALEYVEVVEGSSYEFSKVKDIAPFTATNKVIYNDKGSDEVIPKKVLFATEKFESLSPESGIKIDGVGWVKLKDLNLHVGHQISQLSCPGHNTRHADGKGAHITGYAFATRDEGGDVWIQCQGAECKNKTYKVAQEDFNALTKLSDLFNIRRLVSLSAYSYEKGAVFHVKEDGSSVMFRWKDVFKYWDKSMFFKIPLDLTEENFEVKKKLSKKLAKARKHGEINKIRDVEDEIAALEYSNEYDLIEKALGNEKYFQKFRDKYPIVYLANANSKAKARIDTTAPKPHEQYINDIVKNVGDYIETNLQHNSVTYELDPFAPDIRGRVSMNEFKVVTNKLLPKPLTGTPNPRVVLDYKEHNPYLDDMLEMIMAQRYGADKKSSYLWVKADSNWGKSFLFEGMLKGLGYPISEAETKAALKGQPSGLDAEKMMMSSFLFFDEFKGAVSELKNIATEMSVTQKFKSKTVIPVYMKIFASAEDVQSLNSSIGMEDQFANRFLYIEAKGSLLQRELYNRDMVEYKRSIILYVNKKLHELNNMYLSNGRSGSIKKANELYNSMIVKYSIRNSVEKATEVLPKMFRDWVAMVKSREKLLTDAVYKDCLLFTKKGIHILNQGKAKEIFIDEYLDRTAGQIAKHKTNCDIFGTTKRSSILVNGAKKNSISLEY